LATTTPDPSDEGSRERLHRPEPEREGPIRGGWLGLFGPPLGGADSASGAAGSPEGAAPVGLNDAVARAVDLGYRVVDDYIRQGQNAARLFRQRSYGPEALRHDLQELGVRMFQYASDLAGLWFEAVGAAASGEAAAGRAAAEPPPSGTGRGLGLGGAAARPSPPADPAPGRRDAQDTAPAPPYGARVSVRLESARSAEVQVDLRPVLPRTALLVHDLRAVDPTRPPLREVAVESGDAGDPVVVRIRVPDDQPAGTYRGVVVDARTSLPLGTLSVRVSP
jgi:hypothetical protein